MITSSDMSKGYANSMYTRNKKNVLTKTVIKIIGKHANHHFCYEIKTLKLSRREVMKAGMPLFTCSSVTNQRYGT